MLLTPTRSGTLAVPLVTLADATDGTQHFAGAMRKQRSSLVMTNVNGTKTVFFASGSVMETANGSSGWVFAFDVASNEVTYSLAMSQWLGAGVWMAGQGLAADAQGFLYGISGKGSYVERCQYGWHRGSQVLNTLWRWECDYHEREAT